MMTSGDVASYVAEAGRANPKAVALCHEVVKTMVAKTMRFSLEFA